MNISEKKEETLEPVTFALSMRTFLVLEVILISLVFAHVELSYSLLMWWVKFILSFGWAGWCLGI